MPGFLVGGFVACGPGEGRDDGGDAAMQVRADTTAAVQDTARRGGVRLRREGGVVTRETRVRVAGIPVTVEVAESDEARQRGLMYRDSLPEDHGMLFVYPEERRLSFWMRNTQIPLDIAFLDRGGTIVDIQQMEPFTDETHVSGRPAMYALEMRKGWFEEHGVEVGDRVEF